VTDLQPARHSTLLNHSAYIFLIRFFPSLAMLVTTILFSRALPEGSYGAYQHFWVQFYVFSAVACLGIHALVLTYPPAVPLRLLRSAPRLALALPLWMLATGAIFALIQYRAGFPFLMPLAFLCILSCSVVAESVLITFKHFRMLALANVLYAVLFCAAHWLMLSRGYGLNELFGLISLIALLRLAWYIPVIVRLYRQETAREDQPTPAPADVRSLWIHMGIYDLSQLLFRWIDKLVIAFVVSAELFAVYYNGTIEIPFLPLILSAAGSAGLIQLASTKDAAGDRAEHARQLLLATGRMLSCIVFPLFFFLLFFRYELFEVVLSSKYLPSVPVFLVSLLAVPVRAYGFTTVLQHYHKGRIINIGAVLDLALACLLMYPLYRLLGLPGVALSFVITTYLQAAFYLYHTARVLNTSAVQLLPWRNWLWKLTLSALIFFAAHRLLNALFNQPIALMTGAVLLALCVPGILGMEIRAGRGNAGVTTTQR
jgi:O-antigen/teichoic acid export membrane protein